MGVPATAFVLAGGDSRRMGVDKALLPWGESTLLDHALDRLRRVVDDVRILCGPAPRYTGHGAPVVVDAVREAGALGALLTALERSPREWILLLAVDLPAVPSGLLTHLVERAATADAAGRDAVVPVTERGPEPLCAAYRQTSLPAIRRALAASDRRLTAFWPDVRIVTLGESELACFGPTGTLFANANTPEEYERTLRERRPLDAEWPAHRVGEAWRTTAR
jgi:molybdopterin-guanine dinucleotide biosynthesis protein A